MSLAFYDMSNWLYSLNSGIIRPHSPILLRQMRKQMDYCSLKYLEVLSVRLNLISMLININKKLIVDDCII